MDARTAEEDEEVVVPQDRFHIFPRGFRYDHSSNLATVSKVLKYGKDNQHQSANLAFNGEVRTSNRKLRLSSKHEFLVVFE